jgi:superfamily I DNA/RNA helicase
MGKQLWTDVGDGELISIYSAFNEQDEAYFVVEKIAAWIRSAFTAAQVIVCQQSQSQRSSRCRAKRLLRLRRQGLAGRANCNWALD